LKSYTWKLHFNTTLLSTSGSYLEVHLGNDIVPSVTPHQNYRTEEKKVVPSFQVVMAQIVEILVFGLSHI
jgi:hypothetical protein